MFDDIIKSAREQVAERLASPILGSFAISWCLWNYKFLVILFSDASVSRTFQLIDAVAFPELWSIIGRGVVFPAITAAVYIFLYPYPARFVYGFTRRQQQELNALRQNIENETLLSVEESREIRADVIKREGKQREDLDRLTSEISRLKSELVSAQQPRTQPEPVGKNDAIQPQIEDSQARLMKQIERAGGKLTLGTILGQSKGNKVKIDFDLGELERLKLVKKDFDNSERDYTYEFTHGGRRAVLSMLLNEA